jgi:hypothetical protein
VHDVTSEEDTICQRATTTSTPTALAIFAFGSWHAGSVLSDDWLGNTHVLGPNADLAEWVTVGEVGPKVGAGGHVRPGGRYGVPLRLSTSRSRGRRGPPGSRYARARRSLVRARVAVHVPKRPLLTLLKWASTWHRR